MSHDRKSNVVSRSVGADALARRAEHVPAVEAPRHTNSEFLWLNITALIAAESQPPSPIAVGTHFPNSNGAAESVCGAVSGKAAYQALEHHVSEARAGLLDIEMRK
jgi:hypothetical protein